MIVRLKNQKIIWVKGRNRDTNEGILLSEFVYNLNFRYVFDWNDVEYEYPMDKDGV